MVFSLTRRLGSEAFRLSQIQDGEGNPESDCFYTLGATQGKARQSKSALLG